jgi:hypothetical protein
MVLHEYLVYMMSCCHALIFLHVHSVRGETVHKMMQDDDVRIDTDLSALSLSEGKKLTQNDGVVSRGTKQLLLSTRAGYHTDSQLLDLSGIEPKSLYDRLRLSKPGMLWSGICSILNCLVVHEFPHQG